MGGSGLDESLTLFEKMIRIIFCEKLTRLKASLLYFRDYVRIDDRSSSVCWPIFAIRTAG